MLVECSSRSGKTSGWNTQLTLSNLFPQKRMKLHTLKLPVNIAICCTLSYCQDIYTRDMSHSYLISLWLGRLWSWTPTSPPQHEQSTSSKQVIKCSPKYLCLGIFPILFWWLWNIPLGTSAGLYGAVSSSDLALLANSLSTVPFFFPPVSSLLTWLFTFWSFLARCRPICIERSEFPLILRAEYTMSKNDGL